jgi:hypothetical protein
MQGNKGKRVIVLGKDSVMVSTHALNTQSQSSNSGPYNTNRHLYMELNLTLHFYLFIIR